METLYSATVLGSSVYLILWFFVIYSFLGVFVVGRISRNNDLASLHHHTDRCGKAHRRKFASLIVQSSINRT